MLDELYLDTTYCSPQYETFPTRAESEEKIWELCQKWIRKNGMFKDTRARHVVLFHLPPRYGYESILRHVFMKSSPSWAYEYGHGVDIEWGTNSGSACGDMPPLARCAA